MCVCVCVCILHHTPCVCISFCRVRYMYNIHRIISVCIVLRQTLVYSMRYANQSMHAQLRITFWYDVHKYSTIFGIRCCFWLCHSYIKRSNTVTDLSGCWWYLWMTNRYVWAIVAVKKKNRTYLTDTNYSKSLPKAHNILGANLMGV